MSEFADRRLTKLAAEDNSQTSPKDCLAIMGRAIEEAGGEGGLVVVFEAPTGKKFIASARVNISQTVYLLAWVQQFLLSGDGS